MRVASRRRGQALVEFALIALVFYLLLAVTIEFGRLIFSAQALQDATRVLAREVAVTPFAAGTADLQTALDDDVTADPLQNLQFKARVYDEQWLFVDLANVPNGDLDTFFASKPLVNQMLRPLMIFETLTDSGGNTHSTVHYPGALVNHVVNGVTVTTVLIPQVVEVSATGPYLAPYTDTTVAPPTLEWLPVVQEVIPATGSQFPASNGGLVSLRINYPFQSAALTGFQVGSGVPPPPDLGNPVISNDGTFDAAAEALLPPGFSYFKDTSSDGTPGPYSGQAGLGNQFAFAMTVRPYRKVISAQAVFRREILFR
jgi:Flp pilus assembly protein TadG